jgi:hypothetical protein
MFSDKIVPCYKDPAELVLFHHVEMRFNVSTTYDFDHVAMSSRRVLSFNVRVLALGHHPG